MFSKAVVVFLVVASVVYTEGRPQLPTPATEVIKEQLFRSPVFSSLIQTIWQQVLQEYNRPQPGTNPSSGPFSSVPPQNGGSRTKMTLQTFGNQQVNVDKVRAALFSSETFNNLITQIWQQISSQYAPSGSTPHQTNQNLLPPTNVDGSVNVEAVKSSIFGSESFNSLIQQIWQQISSQQINSEQNQVSWGGSGGQINHNGVNSGSGTTDQMNSNQNEKHWNGYGGHVNNNYGHNSGTATTDQTAALNAHYTFGTEIIDDINGSYQTREEKRENGKVVGSYAYDNGHLYRTVHYEADDKGFRIISDESVPSVVAQRGRSGVAQVKTHRDGSTGRYLIEDKGTSVYHGPV